jgi:hypothetical protein
LAEPLAALVFYRSGMPRPRAGAAATDESAMAHVPDNVQGMSLAARRTQRIENGDSVPSLFIFCQGHELAMVWIHTYPPSTSMVEHQS